MRIEMVTRVQPLAIHYQSSEKNRYEVDKARRQSRVIPAVPNATFDLSLLRKKKDFEDPAAHPGS
jgi:hypothetical protein